MDSEFQSAAELHEKAQKNTVSTCVSSITGQEQQSPNNPSLTSSVSKLSEQIASPIEQTNIQTEEMKIITTAEQMEETKIKLPVQFPVPLNSEDNSNRTGSELSWNEPRQDCNAAKALEPLQLAKAYKELFPLSIRPQRGCQTNQTNYYVCKEWHKKFKSFLRLDTVYKPWFKDEYFFKGIEADHHLT